MFSYLSSVGAKGDIKKSRSVSRGELIGTKLGANVTTNPGTLLGKNCSVYPNISVKGYHAPGSIINNNSGCRPDPEEVGDCVREVCYGPI